MVKQRDVNRMLTLIDQLYAAALEPEQWGRFLVSAADLFQADNVFVCQLDRYSQTLDYLGLPQENRGANPVRRYAKLLNDDPRRGLIDSRLGQAVHCGTGLSRARLRASRTYRDYLKPLNIEYTMIAALPVRNGLTHDLGLTRGRDRRPFDGNDCEMLNVLVPHLSRGFQISRAVLPSASRPPRAPAPAATIATADGDLVRLQGMFSLSPAQARLAISLFNGNTIKNAAADLGITEGSARQYLKKVFQRTGTRRQLDLVRTLGVALEQPAS